ncbi:MAG: cysteine synthase A [Deltaproteobacteria bacterium]|nr:cysteine synthase A [Deltaproteobacteria bacterium]
MKAQNILATIGNTPCVKINRLFTTEAEIWLKLERINPGGSIKDRIGLAMIEDAEQRGILKKDTLIIEPTSGNTGIALAMVAAVKGYKLLLVMPESMSLERRRYMKALGAQLELTPKEKGMSGAIARAAEIHSSTADSWIPQQFENPVNIDVHRRTTAKEILADFPEGLDYLITGVGTGGHISGCAEILKKEYKNLKVIAVEPEDSPVISGGKPGPHKIQGIGTGFIPKNLNRELIDDIIKVPTAKAFEFAKRCALEEGIFVGISSGASLAAINHYLPNITKNARVLSFTYDTGERYLSVEGLFE